MRIVDMSGIDFYCTHCDFRCDRQSTLNRHKRNKYKNDIIDLNDMYLW